MKADLHVHSTASDGRLTPAELVERAAREGIGVLCITDHDSVEGIGPALEAARQFPSVRVIPGVEISASMPGGEVHILGYFVDPGSISLAKTLERLRNSRRVRAEKMVAKLAGLGMPLDWARVEELAGDGSFGRPHIAHAMLERGYVMSFREAFNKYIGRQGPAYVEREKITPKEAVQLIVEADGLPALAHPSDVEHLDQLIPGLQKVGLVAIEAYYGEYRPDVRKNLASLAEKHGLIPTGGSDYHGLGTADEVPLGGVDVPEESIERLLALAGQRCQLGAELA